MTDTTTPDDEAEYVLLSDPSTGTIARASSILQKNTKLYGPMNALDTSNGSSCWNSDSCPDDQQQYLVLEFGRPVQVFSLKMEFQAGFIAETVTVQLQQAAWITVEELEPVDNHDFQEFALSAAEKALTGTAIKLAFEEFTDFYGRVTIYRLEVWGKEVSESVS